MAAEFITVKHGLMGKRTIMLDNILDIKSNMIGWARILLKEAVDGKKVIKTTEKQAVVLEKIKEARGK